MMNSNATKGNTMDVIINETGAREDISYVVYHYDDNYKAGYRNGIDITYDFIGNGGAFGRDFLWDDEAEAWCCDAETYQWWADVIAAHEALDARIYDLYADHDIYEVDEIVAAASESRDLDAIPQAVHKALDAMYGR